MTAQAIAPLPPDPTPPSARAQDPASGQQFLALLAPARNAGNGDARSATAAPGGNATASSAASSAASSTPAKKAAPGTAASAVDDGNDPSTTTNNGKKSDDGSANAAALAIPLPPPAPLPTPPNPAAANAPPAGAPTTPSPPPPLPSAADNMAALLASNTASQPGNAAASPMPPAESAVAAALVHAMSANAKAAAAPTQAATTNGNGGNGARGDSASGTGAAAASTAAPPPKAAPAPPGAVPLPSVAAQLGARMAAAAPTLTSQPSATLASLAHEAQKAAQEKSPALDGPLANGGHVATALDALHDAAKPAAASPGDKFLASIAKDDATAPAPSAGGAAQTAAPAQAADAANADSTTPPPAAAMTPMATAPGNAAPSPELPLATPPLLPHAVAEQVALNLRQAAKDGSDHIQIQLQPADLGTIDVKLNVSHEGRVMVVVSADRSDTLNLLQQDATNLAQALRDAGLQADSSSLSFNLRGGYQFNQQQAANGGASYADAAGGSLDEPEAMPPLTPALRSHSGSLDIHV
jgi:flagellar hook-length control protein FliK